MLSQIEDFVNWVRRRNPQARTWRDYSYDLQQFATRARLKNRWTNPAPVWYTALRS